MARAARKAKSKSRSSKWIQGAISRPGALTRKAKAAGQTTMTYARAHKGSLGKTGEQARLAITLSRMHKR
jgi:hypothetical protein